MAVSVSVSVSVMVSEIDVLKNDSSAFEGIAAVEVDGHRRSAGACDVLV